MKVRIGSTKYDLKTSKTVVMLNDNECLGCIDGDDNEIIIWNGVPSQTQRQTFWHEVVHGLTKELGLDELNSNEEFTDSLGRMLYAFHEDNKLDKIYAALAD